MKYKIIFFLIWLGALSLIPVTILSVTPLSVALRYHSNLTNFIQRFLGLTAFTLMFFQIILGTFMQKWIEKLGNWIFNFHIFEGILIYILIIMHPIFFALFNYYSGGGIDPFYVFTAFCLYCQTKLEFYYTLGRISFWLINVSILAGLFRASNGFMRKNWRKFHILNYLIFLIVGLHGFYSGTDFLIRPYFTFAMLAYVVVLVIVVLREIPLLYKNFSAWLSEP